jgi:hypothetical protein
MIFMNTPENTPVLVNGVRGTLLIMWTDGTADVRLHDGETLVDVPQSQISLPEIECDDCGMTRGAVMFRDYEAGAEWLDRTCCEVA